MTDTMTRRSTPFGFLSDTRRAPTGRAEALRTVTELLDRDGTASLYRACNLLALVHFRTGDAAGARRLCLAQIAYARAHRHTDRGLRLAVLALQPQVNLIRLKGYAPRHADTALRELAALEPLIDGRGTRLPDYALDDATARRAVDEGVLDRTVLRNVVVQDTCQILWRHHRHDRLTAAAARLAGRWPGLPETRCVQHAAEAPWLVDAAAQPEVRPGLLDGPPGAARRLAYVRLLHIAHAGTDPAAGDGRRARARELVTHLAARRDVLDGPFADPVTPLRWLGSLALTAERAGLPAVARSLFAELAADPAAAADPVLDRLTRERAGLGPRPAPPGEKDPVPAALTARVSARLGAGTGHRDDWTGPVHERLEE
ncbi:hypothetical protein [Streptomyces sp. RFCAC02]|uniref:hypothetical protein n=1 Tax=Streptomyces sp. RFCAC02 TaxID=2499143 RepID=UPI00101F9E5B|nr:hypothetical protein [Streptomyces sp. RFCAC02]